MAKTKAQTTITSKAAQKKAKAKREAAKKQVEKASKQADKARRKTAKEVAKAEKKVKALGARKSGKGAGAKQKLTKAPSLKELDLDAPKGVTGSFREAFKAAPGTELAAIATDATPAFDGKKKHAQKVLDALGEEVSDLQERLYAEASGGGNRSVLLIIQGMDTSGKGGIMRHVVGQVDPQGVSITAFKAPTAEERKHPFLWRIRNALPGAGIIGVFDRSQYEDVLIVRVHDLVPRSQWARRYGQITRFEEGLVDSGTTVIKVMLHLGKDEQGARLAERLERPDKYWKFNPTDLDERAYWDDYQEAYQAVIDKTSIDAAPWYVVPADRKWYARLAVMNLLREHLAELDPQWPAADFDVEEQKARLASEGEPNGDERDTDERDTDED